MRPLLHPPLADLRPEAILHALSDPCRAAIFARVTAAGFVEACAAVSAVGDRVIPKSSLSNHFRVLREAGLIRCERVGVEMRNHSRFDEVNRRFPGLLQAIIVAYAVDNGGAPPASCALGPEAGQAEGPR